MFEFDVKEIEKRLGEENPLMSDSLKFSMAQSISECPPVLYDVIKHWLKGEYLDFEYKGISLKEIVERTNLSFAEALTCMKRWMNKKGDLDWIKQNMEQLYKRDSIKFKGQNIVASNRRNYKWL